MSDPEARVLEALTARLNALEERVAFQDDTIETLNQTITEQWTKIDGLMRQLAALNERLAETETQLPQAANERPPHY